MKILTIILTLALSACNARISAEKIDAGYDIPTYKYEVQNEYR